MIADTFASLDAFLRFIATEVEIIEHHHHPDLSTTTPNGRLRVGGITFNSAADSETVTVGYTGSEVVYTFKTTLGSPGAANVHVKVQGSVIETIQKLVSAIQGTTDASNIAYGSGTQPHPDVRAAYTGCRLSIGTSLHGATATDSSRVPTVVFLTKIGDRTATAYPTTLSTTTSGAGVYVLSAFTRIYSNRYLMTGNAAGAGDRVAGYYQCFIPMNSVIHPTEFVVVGYDVGKVAVEAVSSGTLVYECDGYYSEDEVTFTPCWYGLELSRESTNQGSQQYMVNARRIPAGAGFYLKMRSNGTNVAEWVDTKVQYHVYPSDLSD